ncbi:hypothetical protein U9R90_26770 [Streptomyces sp. E11-3]|uniref:hypothetical protein n=1 Tax=Streptomyces sp. E11-3 TaxID=3110112 RepID=UPI003980A3B7
MRTPSSPVVGTAADIAKNAFSEGELEILFLQAGLDGFMPKSWYGKAKLVAPTVRTARAAAADADPAAVEGLRDFVRLVAEKVAPNTPDGVEAGTPFWKLREAVRSDGFDLHAEYTEITSADPWESLHYRLAGVRLLPLDEPRAPLSAEITALEDDLARLGMDVARSCYQQAVANLVEQRFEAANGQIRAMLEEVAAHLATLHGFARVQQGDGGRAIAYLVDNKLLPPRDGGSFIQGLWQMTHTNGPHPGTSTAGEASFRLQAMTAAARYLVDRFAPPTHS